MKYTVQGAADMSTSEPTIYDQSTKNIISNKLCEFVHRRPFFNNMYAVNLSNIIRNNL